jgi:hypothetical protein
MRRSVEQLAAKQDQMAQNIATLQAIEEDIRQKMSSTPPSPPQQAASIPQPKLPQRLVHILGIARAAPPRLRRKDVFVWKLRGELGDKPPSDPMRFVVRRGVGHPVGFWKQRPWRGETITKTSCALSARAYSITRCSCVTLPITAAPIAAAPVTTAPAPVTTAPTPVAAAPTPMTSPPAPVAASPPSMSSSSSASPPTPAVPAAHLLGLQMFHLVAVGDSGTGILVRWRQRLILCERMQHKRCCPCACGQRRCARSKSNSEFQKVAAFHRIILSLRAGGPAVSTKRQIKESSSAIRSAEIVGARVERLFLG